MATPHRRVLNVRRLRISVLLFVFVLIAGGTIVQRYSAASWKQPLRVTLYPINAAGSVAVFEYIRGLTLTDFVAVAEFLENEAQFYGLATQQPVVIALGPEIESRPPSRPGPRANMLAVIYWSLRLRYWVYQNLSTFGLGFAHTRIFVLYHEASRNQPLAHSFGLQKGMIGVVHAFAIPEQTAQNNIVITHELLHTVGATDKYHGDGYPIFPEGFADPEREPLYPQDTAEIMAGRIPLSVDSAEIPESLEYCVIGPRTATEINW